jgi:hypothetical protein
MTNWRLWNMVTWKNVTGRWDCIEWLIALTFFSGTSMHCAAQRKRQKTGWWFSDVQEVQSFLSILMWWRYAITVHLPWEMSLLWRWGDYHMSQWNCGHNNWPIVQSSDTWAKMERSGMLLARKLKNLEINLSQYHFVLHKSHADVLGIPMSRVMQ